MTAAEQPQTAQSSIVALPMTHLLVPLDGFATRVEGVAHEGDVHLENVHPGVTYRIHVLAAEPPSSETIHHGAKQGLGRVVTSRKTDHPQALASAEFVAKSGEQRVEVPFRRSGSCVLSVRHPDGRPVIGAHIEVTGPTTLGEAAPSGETDADGRLTIRNLLPVEHLVRVLLNARAIAQAKVRIEADASVALDLTGVR